MLKTIEREMTITHKDFYRILPKALRNRKFKINNNTIRINMGNGLVKIELKPERKRKIGSLVLTVTNINIIFEDISSEVREVFCKAFDRSYQKGGG